MQSPDSFGIRVFIVIGGEWSGIEHPGSEYNERRVVAS